ncbi:MAG: DUF4270 family protein [Alphaproteobacteria bacterium]|nr:DUF4270 family protein [Alphaproteobacteria bacterium]
MLNKLKLILKFRFGFFFITCMIFIQCTKIATTNIGLNYIYNVDGINTFDTLLDVITETNVNTDSARIYVFDYADSNIYDASSDVHVLGNISYDPLFGKTQTAFFFEIRAPYYPFSFKGNKDSIVVDSAVLVFDLIDVYGDMTQPVHFNVFNIDRINRLQTTTNYASNYQQLYNLTKSDLVSTRANYLISEFLDSFNFRTEKTTNQIRIPIQKSIANTLLKSYDSFVEYQADSIFRLLFPGFCIFSDYGNALLNINMSATSKSGLYLYYSTNDTDDTSARDTTYTKFFISDIAANFVNRNYQGSEVANHLNIPNDSVVYIQGTPGTLVNIKIPALKNFPNKTIHLAELVTVQAPDPSTFNTYNQYFSPPSFVLINAKDSASQYRRFIPNDFVLGTTLSQSYGFSRTGFVRYDSISPQFSNLVNYSFDITRFFQGVVTRQDTNYNLQLSAPGNDILYYSLPHQYNNNTTTKIYIKPKRADATSAASQYITNAPANGSVRLNGGSKKNNPMKLRVIYSNIKTN